MAPFVWQSTKATLSYFIETVSLRCDSVLVCREAELLALVYAVSWQIVTSPCCWQSKPHGVNEESHPIYSNKTLLTGSYSKGQKYRQEGRIGLTSCYCN